MDLDIIKSLKLNKSKYTIIYFYDDSYKSITKIVVNYFNNKYDLNKNFIKINVTKSHKIISILDLTIYPIIHIYNKEELISSMSCYIPNFIINLDKIYNTLLI
jgi:hypothetical protein